MMLASTSPLQTGVLAQRQHRGTVESRLGGSTFRPDVNQSVPETSQSNFTFAQDAAALFSHNIFR